MGHTHDFLERLRFAFAEKIGALVTGIRHKEVSNDEFVGYVKMSEEEFEKELHEMGFERNPLAYWKTAENFGGEDGSWRYVDGKWQLHLMLFSEDAVSAKDSDDDRTYLFAHWEYRWDRYPILHLRGTDGSIQKGVNQMRRHLNLASIPFHDDRTIQ